MHLSNGISCEVLKGMTTERTIGSRSFLVSIALVSGIFFSGCGKSTYDGGLDQENRYQTPTSLSIELNSGNAATLTWSGDSEADYFVLFYGNSETLNGTNLLQGPSGKLFSSDESIQFQNLVAGEEYYFAVSAKGSEKEESERSRIVALKGPGSTPDLHVGFGVKQLQFSWDAVSDATSYRLYEKKTSGSNFQQLAGALTGTSYNKEISVHRFDWENARYRVEACNVVACKSSDDINVLDGMVQAIGSFSGVNTQGNDLLGRSVALSSDGKTLAVGAPHEDSSATGINGDEGNSGKEDSGAVFVFTRSADAWVKQAFIKASNSDPLDYFGSSVALSSDGNTLAVGAYGEDSAAPLINGNELNNDLGKAGAVYLFRRSGVQWSQEAYVKSYDPGVDDRFGAAVALSGDGETLAVGAFRYTATITNGGAVDVFVRVGGSWQHHQHLVPNYGSYAFYGRSVALSNNGDVMAIGATGVNSDQGKVFVLSPSTSGLSWVNQGAVIASNPGAGDQFGMSIDLSGNGLTLAVGAPYEDGNQSSDDGAAYLFARSAGSWDWSEVEKIKASNADSSDHFGASLALSRDGKSLVIGASGEDGAGAGINGNETSNGMTYAGAAYLFSRSGSDWSQEAYLKSSSVGSWDFFGSSVAIGSDGDTLAVGSEGIANKAYLY